MTGLPAHAELHPRSHGRDRDERRASGSEPKAERPANERQWLAATLRAVEVTWPGQKNQASR